MKRKILGIDIGGTTIKSAIVDITSSEREISVWKTKTPINSDPINICAEVKRHITHYQYGGSVGIGFPGTINKQGVVTFLGNLSQNWVGKNIYNAFAKVIDHRLWVINDADAAGIGELKFQRKKNLPFQGKTLFLTFGTGVGSALFYDETLIPNTEFGQFNISQSLVFEDYISRKRREEENLSIKEWAMRLNELLTLYQKYFSPDQILIGGGIISFSSEWLPYITQQNVYCAQLGNDAGIIGAAHYAAK